MIVLGLLLILIAVGATLFAIVAPSAAAQTIEVTALGFTVLASPLAMFAAGAVSLALLGLGYTLISGGMRRKARSRHELRQLKEQAASAGASAEGGRRTSRRDDPQKDNTPATGTSTGTKTGTTDSGAGLQSERRADPDLHSPS
jgi:hypothetical protein